MLGVVPLLLIKDYLSIAFPSYFSVVLGLVLLGIVFFIPNGLIGLLHSGKAAIRGHTLADLLEAWARRLRGSRHASPPSATHPPATALGRPPHDPSTAPGRFEREAQS